MSRHLLNNIYLLITSTQLLGMLLLDLTKFYPKPLSQSLLPIRQAYVSFSSDPFFSTDNHEPWFAAFLFIEAIIQLPLALFLVSRLLRTKKLTVGTELAALVFGCVTGMGSVACCFHLWQLGEDFVSAEKKAMLFWGTYFPFALIPIVMTVDMYQRILARVSIAENKSKRQ